MRPGKISVSSANDDSWLGRRSGDAATLPALSVFSNAEINAQIKSGEMRLVATLSCIAPALLN